MPTASYQILVGRCRTYTGSGARGIEKPGKGRSVPAIGAEQRRLSPSRLTIIIEDVIFCSSAQYTVVRRIHPPISPGFAGLAGGSALVPNPGGNQAQEPRWRLDALSQRKAIALSRSACNYIAGSSARQYAPSSGSSRQAQSAGRVNLAAHALDHRHQCMAGPRRSKGDGEALGASGRSSKVAEAHHLAF